jgi:hypothetical protein
LLAGFYPHSIVIPNCGMTLQIPWVSLKLG